MSIGKSLRFEIFARDSFTCQYCGQRPPEIILEVDHIHPSSKGGSNDPINLTTSCFDCNRGKRAKVLGTVAPRPDADIEYLKVQQEHAEVFRYLEAKESRDKLIKQACEALWDVWQQHLTDMVPAERIIIPWILRYGPDEVERSIIIASQAHNRGRFGYDDDRAFHKMLPYIGAVLRNRVNDRENGAVQ